MTPQEFKAWRTRLGLTQAQAGRALGYTSRWIIAFEQGINHRRQPCVIPLSVELACKWLEFGEWRDISTAPDDGTPIILSNIDDGYVEFGHFVSPFEMTEDSDDETPDWFTTEGDYLGSGGVASTAPTHWKPKPQHPEGK